MSPCETLRETPWSHHYGAFETVFSSAKSDSMPKHSQELPWQAKDVVTFDNSVAS